MVWRWLVPILGAGLTVVILFRLYGSLDASALLKILTSAKLIWMVMLAGTILLEQLLNGWKWRLLLHDIKPVPTIRLTGALLAGYGANELVPLGISPLVRAWVVARLEGLSIATVLATTAIARFVDGIVFALLAALLVLAGGMPEVEGRLGQAVALAALINLVLFGGLIAWLFAGRQRLAATEGGILNGLDWLAAKLRLGGANLRKEFAAGIIWPHQVRHQLGVIVAAFTGKLVAATHFLWAGLAVGIRLDGFDYLFLMVFAGAIMVIGRLVRLPGGFIVGAGIALSWLDVPETEALAMILLNFGLTMVLIVGVGLVILWRSGLTIREARRDMPDATP